PRWAVTRERLRGAAALHSLERLGVDPRALADARDRVESFGGRELRGVVPGSAPATKRPDPARPRRLLPAPLHYQRHLLDGYGALPREAREEWRRREQETSDGLLLADLAWYACDGRRTVDEIAALLWLETGRHEPDFVRQFFADTERLGLSTWAEEDASW